VPFAPLSSDDKAKLRRKDYGKFVARISCTVEIHRIESGDFKWKRHKMCSTSEHWLTAFPFEKRVRQSSVATAGNRK
jgi:hypothetical protein